MTLSAFVTEPAAKRHRPHASAARGRRPLNRFCAGLWLLVVLWSCVPALVRANDIQIEHALLEVTEEGPTISADFGFELPSRLEDALHGGIPLYFVIECDITRPRWYWLDERVSSQQMQYRLSFHALTRQYRLSSGALHQNFATLKEAMSVMRRLRGWIIAEPEQLRPAIEYDAWLRMRLDAALLPKPFQVAAITNRELSLGSSWRRWRFAIPPKRSAQ